MELINLFTFLAFVLGFVVGRMVALRQIILCLEEWLKKRKDNYK